MPNKKIPIEKIKKISYNNLQKLINKAKRYIKTNDVMKDICKEYDVDIDIIDHIPTKFGDLDVSAKTDHGVVILNYKLLCDGDFFKDYSYLIHEYNHFFQQCFNSKPTKSSNDGNYLDNKYEQESFQNQVEYIADEFGEDEAEDYVENLLDHHDVKDKNKKDELESIFLENV